MRKRNSKNQLNPNGYAHFIGKDRKLWFGLWST